MNKGPVWALQAREMLKEKGLSQDAIKLALSVETQGAVSHYLTGKRELNVKQLESLASFLETDPNTLMGISNTNNDFPGDELREYLKVKLEHWLMRLEEMGWVSCQKDVNTISDLLSYELSADYKHRCRQDK